MSRMSDDVMSIGGDGNVIYHIAQGETSHFPPLVTGGKTLTMDENETFRANLLIVMVEKGFDAARLSKAAKLNSRAVKDIEERRAVSPKLSTVFKLAKALNVDPSELLGLDKGPDLAPELLGYLAKYSLEDQKKLVLALANLPPPKP